MAYLGNGKVDGRMELEQMLSKRKYPKGKIAINHLAEFFENRLKTIYKDAPAKWKKGYTHAVFSGLEDYKKGIEFHKIHGNTVYRKSLKTGKTPKTRGSGKKHKRGM